MIPGLRHRVAATASPRVTAGDAFQTKPASPHASVRFHCFEKISRTTRFKTASGTRAAQPHEKRRNRPLIQQYPGAYKKFHVFKYPALTHKERHSESNARKVAVTAARRNTTTIHNPAGKSGRCVRKISLNLLRARFRSTADPVFLEAITPRRAAAGCRFCQPDITMKFPCQARPRRRTVWNSLRRASRAGFGKAKSPIGPWRQPAKPIRRRYAARIEPRRPWAEAVCDRAGGGGTRWPAHPWFSCAHESHAAVCAYAWKVGKFVS